MRYWARDCSFGASGGGADNGATDGEWTQARLNRSCATLGVLNHVFGDSIVTSTMAVSSEPRVCLPRSAKVCPVEFQSLPLRPLVSIVVPSYNQGRFIRATLESIFGQDYRPLQIIVMDGGSTDETVEVLESFSNHPELEWTSEPDTGVVHAVNKGFARVKGSIVAIQSSDDCYMPKAISNIVKSFLAQSQVGLIYGETIKVDEAGNELLRCHSGSYTLENLFLLKTWIPQPSAFFRRELLDVLGGWDDRIPYAPDTDLWIRMAFRTDVCKINDFLSQRRLHGEQRDVQSRKIATDYKKMIDQSPDIKQAPAAIRNAAHAGKYLMAVRYNHTGSDLYAAWLLLKAMLISRGACTPQRLMWQSTLPIRRALSWAKQNILGLPGRRRVRSY